MERDYEMRYRKFRESKQPAVCLQIALEDFFGENTPETVRQAYEAYLRRRVRPAAEQIILEDDAQKLQKLEQMGWLTPELVDDFCRMAAKNHKGECLMWLLSRKQQVYGFRKPDFSL